MERKTNNVISFELAKARYEGMSYIENMYSYYDGKLSENHLYLGSQYEDIDTLDVED